MTDGFVRRLKDIAGEACVREKEPMHRHTTFRIGGPADIFVSPADTETVRPVLLACREAGVPCFILGNGSNLLISDEGFRGCVVRLDANLQKTGTPEKPDAGGRFRIRAQAGTLLGRLAALAREYSLTGLEFASGIPGTLGGAVTMNAGAYGGEMRQVLRQARVLDGDLTERTAGPEELEMGYRTSLVKTGGWVVLEAELELAAGLQEEIAARMEELRQARTEKQPLEYPSAGSTFKRPEGYFAGKLIMDAGLRGLCIGGAQVSEKHCGFIINRGGATAEDVRRLMETVQQRVFQAYGILLEPEVRFLGFGDAQAR